MTNRSSGTQEETSVDRETKQCSNNKDVDYDQLLSAAGEFGLYQTFLIFLTCPFYFYGVCAYFGQLFLTEPSPNHWCWVPELENLTDLERRTLAIPLDENARFGYSQCSMYVANWTEVLSSGARPNTSWITQPCQNGWEFNKTEIPYPTITSEMGWVCDKGSYQATAQAANFVGSVAGGFLLGWVSDRFGRIAAAVVSNMIGCVAGIVSIFAKNFIEFCLCRFLMGVAYDSCMMMIYLLVLESVAPKYRTLMANLPFGIFYSLSAMALPWIAIACGHWKTLSLVTSVPMALVLIAPFIVPESPRWLLIKGRIDETINRVISISRINKKEIPSQLIEQFKVSSRNQEQVIKSRSLLDLTKKPLLRKMFVCLCIEYMCCMIIFDALIRSLGGLQFDFFISFTLVSLTEFPSLVLVSFILDLTGRKWLSILCLLVSGIFSVLTAFLSGGLLSVLCAVAARFAVNMCVNIALQWGAEMMPTQVRGSSQSVIHICGYIATILSPYIVYLEIYVTWLPLVIVGIVAIIAALSAIALPETACKDMPQTFEDAEVLITNQKMFEIPCLNKRPVENVKGETNLSFELN
ncbi:carcinine transporter-like [Epargyreus clarus]|uniref:carcinine transporter-like n=1 Tax=Epargyreus clarus TaxID=520877 RepID=UPI003C2F7D33